MHGVRRGTGTSHSQRPQTCPSHGRRGGKAPSTPGMVPKHGHGLPLLWALVLSRHLAAPTGSVPPGSGTGRCSAPLRERRLWVQLCSRREGGANPAPCSAHLHRQEFGLGAPVPLGWHHGHLGAAEILGLGDGDDGDTHLSCGGGRGCPVTLSQGLEQPKAGARGGG